MANNQTEPFDFLATRIRLLDLQSRISQGIATDGEAREYQERNSAYREYLMDSLSRVGERVDDSKVQGVIRDSVLMELRSFGHDV